ncbi:DUF4280 domain-containing protein [Paenibacillus elgii]|uniref:DUF4280 domain-containing protein n=1 Tax=Paenibacillus elgii TaxID=189691 RepID=A0A165Q546_9BACL|nr:DUF4280 domain-containing protein [Paenibacillus elgii]KZE73684.1 hypothetical protein AV654_03660 [Paenibacillus elgii]NEN80897.1 DUF4280 domain-containing protein [Paenibacillus elgii]
MNFSYVVEGAFLQCSCGSAKATFKASAGRNITINGKPQGNVHDFKPGHNIPAFGMCSSTANPEVASATAANQGQLKKMPCKPAITVPWLNGKSDVMIDQFPALLNCSTNLCMWKGQITVEQDGQ